METIIETEALCYKSGQRYLLNHINWKVGRGETWVIFGLNGSGKTTLLSVVSGYCAFTSGTLKVFGESYTNDNIFELRRKIGWVSSSFFERYYKNESVLNVVLSGLFGTFGVDFPLRAKDVRRAKWILHELGIEEKKDVPIGILSKGEKQRVLIARALIAQPEVLILDESTAGLDVYARKQMMNTVECLAQKGLTIIYVTHYPEEVRPFFGKAMLMKNGRIFAKGTVEEIFSSDKLSGLMSKPIKASFDEHQQLHINVEAETHIPELYSDMG